MTLLESFTNTAIPFQVYLDHTSYTTLTTHCDLESRAAENILVTLSRLYPFNVLLVGERESTSSVINLIDECGAAQDSSSETSSAEDVLSYSITIGEQPFVIWDMEVDTLQDECASALKHAVQLVDHLFAEDGIDLLLFCKESGTLTTSEANMYKLFERFLCEGMIPAAVIVTHVESQKPAEWWETNGEDLVKAIGGNVIHHACISSPDLRDLEGRNRSSTESRKPVRAMLQRCISSRWDSGSSLPVDGPALNKMTVRDLVDRCGLTYKVAKELVELRAG